MERPIANTRIICVIRNLGGILQRNWFTNCANNHDELSHLALIAICKSEAVRNYSPHLIYLSEERIVIPIQVTSCVSPSLYSYMEDTDKSILIYSMNFDIKTLLHCGYVTRSG